MTINGNRLIPDEGMILTNGQTYSSCVYLGIYDSPANWHEISAEDVPDDQNESDADTREALNILLGR